ncbi:MAG: FAD-dependent oxidoreductase [Nitrospira sp.]|nr:FAD-dependent oxidoreductase [Nitrospira sp.]
MRSYDLVVIGSGPAGQKAAVQAAKLSKRVALIEKAPQLGGTSLNTGTLPSKTLKDTIEYLQGLGRRGLPQLGAELTRRLTLPDLMARKDQVIETEIRVVGDQLQRNKIEILQGIASFIDPHTVRVTRLDGAADQIRASVIVLATGRDHAPRGDPIRRCDRLRFRLISAYDQTPGQHHRDRRRRDRHGIRVHAGRIWNHGHSH